MLILKILKKLKFSFDRAKLKIIKSNLSYKNLKYFVTFFINIKLNRCVKSLWFIYYLSLKENKFFKIENNLIIYIIVINNLKTNTLINVNDINGKNFLSISSGNLGYKGKQKIKQPIVFISLLKLLIKKMNFLKNKSIVLHFKNIKPYLKLFLINQLKLKFFIKKIRNYSLNSFNGCRPKKIKRLRNK